MKGYDLVPIRHFQMPPNAVRAGHDLDGSEIFVGVSHYRGDEIPCKIVPRRLEAYISYKGEEISVQEIKVLTEKKMQWISASNGHVPPGALPAGRICSGEALYIGRTNMNGYTVTGKVHPSHRCLYVPFNGKEVSHRQYEVLAYE